MISANYDALGAAPSMQAGIERSVSSILSVMHLSRLFGGKSSHQSNTEIQTEYEIMYVLTPGASINYESTSQFIDFLPGGLRSRIELAVCLDGMVDSTKSWKEGQNLNIFESDSGKSTIKDRFLAQLEHI